MIPTSRIPDTVSLGRNLIASSATKIGTGAFAIPAIDEVTCSSPQAMSVNGSAVLMTPRTTSPQPARADVGDRAAGSLLDHQDREQDERGEEKPECHERDRVDLVHGDRDEHVRRAPDRGHEDEQGEVAAGHRRHASDKATPRADEGANLRALSPVAEQPLHRALGLTDGELDRICVLLEREPNDFELAVFSLLWSEHCGYKHSALLLRRFPTEGAAVLQGPGENAGVVDVGDGQAVAFKVESHNHPSAVEPFQGAATGVGGILRDIIAMGARPIALLDGLRFGDPGFAFGRAVAGIGHYGNCVGVPTVGGEAVFDESTRRTRS